MNVPQLHKEAQELQDILELMSKVSPTDGHFYLHVIPGLLDEIQELKRHLCRCDD